MYGGFAQDTTAVLLPLQLADSYRARVLLAGASMPYILDLGSLGSGWIAAPRTMNGYPDPADVNPRRENLDAVLLPTGEVFIEGGVKNPTSDASAVKRGELFNPDTMTWKVLPEAERPRQYHSVSVLMPDGAVWVAGSNFNSSTGLANRELRIEIFEPWYFCGRRPVITDAAHKACHGEEFEIRTADAASIKRAVIVRCGSVTHNYTPDQRHVTLKFRHDKSDILVATVPDEPAVAIAGYYLLFVIDDSGRPSVGRFIQICRSGQRRWHIRDDDFRRWLYERLGDGFRLDEADLRALQRAVVPPDPPRRRVELQGRPHGEHDQGPAHEDHDHDDDHDHGHSDMEAHGHGRDPENHRRTR
jgi:hypothetical protein